MYSSTLSLTSTLDGERWPMPNRGRLIAGKETVPSGPQGRSGQVRKISPPSGFDPRTAQTVASHYTD